MSEENLNPDGPVADLPAEIAPNAPEEKSADLKEIEQGEEKKISGPGEIPIDLTVPDQEKNIIPEKVLENAPASVNRAKSKGVKKPTTGKKHIIDELNLDLHKHATIPILNCITPPAKYPKNKDFIKKNIQRSAAYLNKGKILAEKDEAKASELFEECNKKPGKAFDVNERFYKKAEDYKKKKEEMKEKFKKDELDGCTFQPKTNSKEKVKQSPKDFNKKLDDYIERKRKKQEDAQIAKTKEIEEKQNIEDLTYKPKICEKSKSILSKKPVEGPIYERLYNQGKNQASKQIQELDKEKEKEADPNKTIEEPEVFFHPTINKKSQNMLRPDKIEKILYDDAIRRKNKPPQAPTSPVHKFMNSNSEKVLLDKFKRDFTEATVGVELKINYNQFLEISDLLHFIREESEEQDRLRALQIWKSFAEDEENGISKEILLAVCLGIMGLYEDWMENFKISREIAGKLHKKYEFFYKNRLLVTNKSSQSGKGANDYSFMPEKYSQNDELAEKWKSVHREPGRIEDNLIAECAKKEKKIQLMKQKIEAEQLKECSFKPKTEELPAIYVKNSNDYSKEGIDSKSTHKGVVLYTLANKNKEKKENFAKSSKALQEEKELEECTFSPNILDKNEGHFNSFMQRMQANEDFKKKNKQVVKNNFKSSHAAKTLKNREVLKDFEKTIETTDAEVKEEEKENVTSELVKDFKSETVGNPEVKPENQEVLDTIEEEPVLLSESSPDLIENNTDLESKLFLERKTETEEAKEIGPLDSIKHPEEAKEIDRPLKNPEESLSEPLE